MQLMGDEVAGNGRLERVRTDLEGIDRAILSLVARRVRAAREAGRAKRETGAALLDPAREAAVVRRAAEGARRAGLPEEDVRALFWNLIGLCRRAQESEPLR